MNLCLYFSSKDEAGSTAPYESAYIHGGGHSEADEGRCYLGEGARAVKLDLCAGLNPDSPGPQWPPVFIQFRISSCLFSVVKAAYRRCKAAYVS